MFAVIMTGGKQYLVREKDKFQVERLKTEEGKTHTFERVLLFSKDDKTCEVGKPYLAMKVEARVLRHLKAPKVRVFKMKAKKNYRRTQGHRQPMTEVEVVQMA